MRANRQECPLIHEVYLTKTQYFSYNASEDGREKMLVFPSGFPKRWVF